MEIKLGKIINDIYDFINYKIINKKIERNKNGGYFTFKKDSRKIMYCTACFDDKHKEVQVILDGEGRFFCPICKLKGVYDEKLIPKADVIVDEKIKSFIEYGNNF